MDWTRILAMFDGYVFDITDQIKSASVVDVTYTDVGVFVDFFAEGIKVSEEEDFTLHGVELRSQCLRYDVSALLHFKFGIIKNLELVSNGGESLRNVDFDSLTECKQ